MEKVESGVYMDNVDSIHKVFAFRKMALLCCGCIVLAFLIISFMLPLVDPSEGRYAIIAQRMAETGDYVTPQVLSDGKWIPFLGKPPLFFWLASISIKIFGVNEFAVRFPAVLSSILLLISMFFIIKRYKDEETAFLSVLITATSGLFFVVTNSVLADVLMTFCSMGAFLFYYAFLKEQNSRVRHFFSMAVFILLGLGFLTKGPVAIVIFGLPVFLWTLFNNQWKTLKHHAWISGCSLFLAITVPWFYLVSKVHPDFLEYFFVNENFKRFVSSDYGDRYGTGHQYPRGMSAAFFAAGAEPWLLLILIVIIYKCIKLSKDNRKQYIFGLIFSCSMDDENQKRPVSFFFLGFVSVVLFWCLAKQLHFYYLLTVIPPFAIWCAILLKGDKIPFKITAWLSLFTLIIYIIGFSFVPFVAEKRIARNVIAKAIELHANSEGDPKIVFVYKTPFSAYFYGKGLIVQHTKEIPSASLARKADYYIIKNRYFDKMSVELRNDVSVRYKDNKWSILQKPAKSLGAVNK
jgi:4-amino-4-deoxy-L-arabinose transferase-like glycosyltransferase